MAFRVKKLESHAIIPSRAHETDAAFDLYSNDQVVIPPGGVVTVGTGISIEIIPGFVGLVFSRSGHGKPQIRISLANSVGVIDAGYMGEIKVNVENRGTVPFIVNRGDRIAQIAIMPVSLQTLVEEKQLTLEEWAALSERGANGFGSTGR